ncbi:MAG: Coenzyme F420 hydrogenase/dehydrogenase, beta subunit C-terminal domain [Paludibacteraceae bacterium]
MIVLCDEKYCTGCGACVNICPRRCISMDMSFEGFLYPQINRALCIECGACQKACPVLTPIKYQQLPMVYAAWSKDEAIRQRSSSGGVFYILAEWIIARGGCVFGVVYDDDMGVIHTKATTLEQVREMMGSKYLQSDTRGTYREVKDLLKEGKIVLYTGTPCQIAGLLGYLGKRNISNLYLVDLVCHGTPSKQAFSCYLHELETLYGMFDKKSFSFRQLEAWGISPSFKLAESRKVISSKHDWYMKAFLQGLLSRESCYHCLFAVSQRVSDLTVGDFWGIGAEKPFEQDTSKGCSLVLVNTEKGARMLSVVSSDLFLQKRTLSEALSVNHQLYRPPVRPRLREYAYTIIKEKNGWKKLLDSHLYDTPYKKIRHVVGEIYRWSFGLFKK